MNKTLEIPHLVLTGGPCGGKTTALEYVREKLLDRGFYPIILPEISTLLIQSGITPINGILPVSVFENLIVDQTLFFERMVAEATKKMAHKKIVVIHDRGLMDIKSYMSDDEFYDLRNRYGLSVVQMRDERYKAVFHLRTAAQGAEELYTCVNNRARTETIEEARALDERTLNAWTGHKKLVVIDNSTDFQGKLSLLLRGIFKELAIPTPLNIERKFTIMPVDLNMLNELGLHIAEIDIEQFYITPHQNDGPDVEVRLRKRTQYGESIYWESRKERLSNGKYFEHEHQISPHAYQSGMKYKVSKTSVIQKKRYCFVHKDQYFELDIFSEWVRHGLQVLEVKPTDESQAVMLPEFLGIIKEVTGEIAYTNRRLAES